MEKNYSEVVDELGGVKITISSNIVINPLEGQQLNTIEQILSMSDEEKVEWILRQPDEMKNSFLKWKTLSEIRELPEEEMMALLLKLIKLMPSRMIYNILSEAGYTYK